MPAEPGSHELAPNLPLNLPEGHALQLAPSVETRLGRRPRIRALRRACEAEQMPAGQWSHELAPNLPLTLPEGSLRMNSRPTCC